MAKRVYTDVERTEAQDETAEPTAAMTAPTITKRIPVPEDRQCTAHKSGTQDRCKSAAIKGGTVCVYHGGSAKHVRDAAQRRLLEAVDPALAKLVSLVMRNDDKTTGVQYQAAKDILDRAGLGAVQKIEVETGVDEFAMYLRAMADLKAEQEGANE